MNEIEYRTFQIADYESAIALWQHTDGVGLRGADSYDGIARYLARNPNLSFAALSGDELVGTILSGHDGRRGYVQHLAVHQDYRGHGIATQLVALVLDALKEEGILKSHIHVFAHNVVGKEFWLNRGWHERTDLIVCSFIHGDNQNV